MDLVDGLHGISGWNESNGWLRDEDLGDWSQGGDDGNSGCCDETDMADLVGERTCRESGD